jgi:hypothetical protein
MTTIIIIPTIIKIIHHGKLLVSELGSSELDFNSHEILSDEIFTIKTNTLI